MMAKKKVTRQIVYEDDSRYSDNPQVPKVNMAGVKRRVKTPSKSMAANRIFGNKQQPPKKNNRKRVFVKE